MANGNRDVDLVIRARNEASKAVDAVTSALGDLTRAQVGVTKGSEKTGSTLSELGVVLTKLNQQIGGVSTLDRLAGSMDRAAGSVARLESSISSLTNEQADLAAEVQVTESAMARLTAEALNLQGTLSKQSAASKSAKAELAALNAEVKSGETALSKSVSDSRAYENQLTKLESKLTQTQTRHRELTQEILRAENPSKRLVASFEKTDAALGKQVAALAEARSGYAANANATKEIEASLDRLRAAQSESAAAFDRARSAQEASANSLKQIAVQVREADKQLSALKATAGDNAVALERQDKALAKARQELIGVEAAAKQADIALDKIGNNVRSKLLRSLVDSQKALVDYRVEWQRATAAVSAAVASGQSTANPSPELRANLEVARASKVAYQEMQVAIQQMRTAVREAGTDVVKLASAQQTFTAALDRVRTKSAQVTAAQQQQAAASTAAGQAAVSAANQQAGAYNRVASAVNRLTAESRGAAGALDDLEGRGRQALSWGQRLRSEVIALTTAYVGFYAAIEQLKGVTRTFQDLEAAQARLNVAFDGNSAVVAREFRFMQEEANRLGVDVRVLASEYSKLAVATKGSALEGDATRKIFVSMTEAFRVNKLSTAQMELAFNAVTQIVNKQAVSMEELRQQLGEKLPGALTLAAKAMGLTGKEFNKLVSTGNLAADDFLPKFAEELDKTFGPQLPESLKSLSSEIGRFGNEVTQAQVRVANAGFIEGLRAGLESLTKFFQSDEGVAFFNNLGAASGFLIKVLAAIPQYIDEISLVLAVLIGRKATTWVKDLAGGFTQFTAQLKPLPAAINQASAATNAFAGVGGRYITTVATAAPATQRLTVSVTALTASLRSSVAGFSLARAGATALTGSISILRGAFALLGGIPGIIITGLSVAFSYWLTSTDDVINATEEHKKQMTEILDLYSRTKGGAEGWATAIKGVNVLNASKVAEDLRDQLQGEIEKISINIETNGLGRLRLARGDFGETGKELFELLRQAERGEITVQTLSKRLNELGQASSNAAPEIKKALIDAGKFVSSAAETETALSKQVLIAEKAGGAISGVSPAVRALTKDLEDLQTEADNGSIEKKLVDPAEQLAVALDNLRNKVPSLTAELKLLEQVKEIDEILKTADAIKGLDKTSEAYKRLVSTAQQAKAELEAAFNEKQFKESYDLLSQGGTAVEQSAALIRKREGYRETPYFDVNAYRAGFGSDTVTLADGSVQKVVQGMKVSVADANRDLVRRIGEFQATVRGQVGAERFNSFNPQQQAVLTSIAYNYGSLPERILEAVRKGSSEEIAASIKTLAGDNNGINSGRRQEEAYLFQNADKINATVADKTVADQLKDEERRAEQATQYRDRLAEQLALRQQDAEVGKQKTLQETIDLAIAKEQVAAKKAGTELTASEKQQITETVTILYQRKAAEDAILASKKQQEEAEARLNTLTQLRRDLMEQMRFAMERGNTEQYAILKEQLLGVETQLRSAIDAQIAFWDAAKGGPDGEKAAAAIANLQLQKNALLEVEASAWPTATAIGSVFGQNLLSGANSFLDKIRETGDVIGSLREAFMQFASDFLLQIAKMILQQAILNALKAAGSGGGGWVGAIAGAVGAGVQHTGGIAGAANNRSRSVSPAWFANATRYHSGGIAGLKPNEVPTILEKGEEVLPESDPRHMNNGGGAASNTEVKIVNAIDAGSFVSAGVEDIQGQKAIINFMRANSGAVKSALGM
jgi:tape measure domain-containing protein